LIGVAPSTLPHVGRGIFNISGNFIDIGNMFGPYKGEVLNMTQFPEERNESSCVRKVENSDKNNLVGFVDPCTDTDPATNWLALVNSACERRKFGYIM
jgi:hypothetical protein